MGPPQARGDLLTRRLLVVLLALALVAAACSSDKKEKQASKPGRVRAEQLPTTSVADSTSSSDAATSSSAAAPGTTKRTPTTRRGTTAAGAGSAPATNPPAAVAPKLTKVASLSKPVAIAFRPGDTGVFVAEQVGRVRVFRNGSLNPNAVVDVSGEISTGNEQGLLGLAFSPDGNFLYIHLTDRSGNIHLYEYPMAGGARRELLVIDHSSAGNHNGGQLQTGPDGMLYDAVGDGGGAGDPENDAQNTGNLLGKILRIDPRNPSGGRAYGIPAGNPFNNEIWEYGLRNPWRFSFDRGTGDLWIGDVGQDAWEEIDVDGGNKGGRNYGWPAREGAHSFRGTPPPGAVDPVYEYSQDGGGCAVVGGYLYRGNRFPQLVGSFIFSDNCIGRIWSLKGGARSDLGLNVPGASSFGEGPDAELWVTSVTGGGLYRFDAA